MVYIAIKESPKYVNDNLLGFYIQLSDIFDTREIIRRVFSKLADKKSVAHLFSIERDYIFEDVDRNCEVFSLNSLYNYMESSLFINRLLLSVFPCATVGPRSRLKAEPAAAAGQIPALSASMACFICSI